MKTLALTRRQQQVLDLIRKCRDHNLLVPTLREIADHLGTPYANAAKLHVDALCRKGFLERFSNAARALRLTERAETQIPAETRQDEDGEDPAPPDPGVEAVPILGSIPAGLADLRYQEPDGLVHVDLDSLNIPRSSRMFALRVTGDSMIGKFILEGDIVVLEQNAEPRPGDVVAAFIDGQSTLKTFILDRGRPCLRAENPRYPHKLIPLNELMIQGVMRLLIRPFDKGR